MYVQEIINNPDLRPNATINWWIIEILLLKFCLVHVLATCHMGADGLSHCPLSQDDSLEEEDFKDWLDKAYSFSISLLNDHLPILERSAHTF